MKTLWWVALGGAFGAVSRYSFGQCVARLYTGYFPLATWLINVLGSFIIGMLFVFIMERVKLDADMHSVFVVGFLGAFTTFSSFSLEAVQLLQNGRLLLAMFYVLSSVLVCLLATWLGVMFARML